MTLGLHRQFLVFLQRICIFFRLYVLSFSLPDVELAHISQPCNFRGTFCFLGCLVLTENTVILTGGARVLVSGSVASLSSDSV